MYRNHMKTLFILRHGEAEPNFHYGNDFFRKLNQIGNNQLILLQEKLKSQILSFDLVYISSSIRTTETFELLRVSLNPKNVIFSEKLYTASYTDILNLVQSLNEDIESIAIIGHNPAVSEFVGFILGESYINMSPGTCFHLSTLVSDWEMIGKNTAEAKNIFT